MHSQLLGGLDYSRPDGAYLGAVIAAVDVEIVYHVVPCSSVKYTCRFCRAQKGFEGCYFGNHRGTRVHTV